MTTDDPPVALDPSAALQRIDRLLAQADPWTPRAVEQLAGVLRLVPGRQARVARRLRDLATAESLALLLEMDPTVPGVVEATHHLFGAGIARRFAADRRAPLGLCLELWPSRARQAPALRKRAAHVFGPRLEALDVEGARVLRGTVAQGEPRLATVAADLEWLIRAALGLARTVVWIDGWRFDATSLHGPSVAVHYVRRVLDRMRRRP